MSAVKSVTLYKTEGKSDKVYQVSIKPSGDAYLVEYQNGRRGSTLRSGLKTEQPVSLEAAEEIYNSTVKSKTKDGYTADVSGSTYSGTENAGRVSGFLPQLLNEVTEDDLPKFINDPNFGLQEKKNGERQLMISESSAIVATNRLGLTIATSDSRAHELTELLKMHRITGNTVFDGESMGDYFYAFDLLVFNGKDVRPLPFVERDELLNYIITQQASKFDFKYIKKVPTYFSAEDKLRMVQQFKKENAEGFVFKNISASYTEDRPSSGGDQLKFKFKAMATVEVAALNAGKRSVAIAMLDGLNKVAMGNVTIPSNADIPKVGSLIEVEYLDCVPGGSLFQPVYQFTRTDKLVPDQVSTVKIKRVENHDLVMDPVEDISDSTNDSNYEPIRMRRVA